MALSEKFLGHRGKTVRVLRLVGERYEVERTCCGAIELATEAQVRSLIRKDPMQCAHCRGGRKMEEVAVKSPIESFMERREREQREKAARIAARRKASHAAVAEAHRHATGERLTGTPKWHARLA